MMEIISPSRREHAGEMIELIGKVFSEPAGYFYMRDFARNTLFYGPYDWETSRIGLLDGRIVTHWGVIPYTMRIGSARVRLGGVTYVATHADYRKRGFMEQTAWASINAMREAGYDMTMLFGIDDYYDQYGYVNAWPETKYTIKTAPLPSDRPAVALRKFAPRYLDQITTLYNREYARCTGTAVRTVFPRPYARGKSERYLWLADGREPVGYVVTEKRGDELTCHEHCGNPNDVLRVLGHLAHKSGRKEVRFLTLHGARPLAARLRRLNCRVETDYRRSGGPMISTLNLRSTLKKLTRELSRRLKKSHLAGWGGELLIADPREKVVVKVGRANVTLSPPTRTKHTIRGGEAIARLLLGSDGPDEVIEGGQIKTTGDARALAEVLFPNEQPGLCQLDKY